MIASDHEELVSEVPQVTVQTRKIGVLHRDVMALADSEAGHIAGERAVWIAVHREAGQIDIVRKLPGSEDLRNQCSSGYRLSKTISP